MVCFQRLFLTTTQVVKWYVYNASIYKGGENDMFLIFIPFFKLVFGENVCLCANTFKLITGVEMVCLYC